MQAETGPGATQELARALEALRLTRSRVSLFRVRLPGPPAAVQAALAALAGIGVVEAITPDQAAVLLVDVADPDAAEARVRAAAAAAAGPRTRPEVAALHCAPGQIDDPEELLLRLAAVPAVQVHAPVC